MDRPGVYGEFHGLFSAWHGRGFNQLEAFRETRSTILPGTALLIGACLASPIRGVLLAGRHPSPLASTYAAWTNYVLALCLIPYALYTTNQKGFRLDGMFADMSYIVYLLHPTVLLWMNDHLGRDRILYDVIGTTFLLLASVAIWQYYDRPINRIRSRWVNSRKKPVKSPVDLSLEPARRGDRCSIS
jgi:peptidoglycan/LPS O-acetylase OafA/YrhL